MKTDEKENKPVDKRRRALPKSETKPDEKENKPVDKRTRAYK